MSSEGRLLSTEFRAISPRLRPHSEKHVVTHRAGGVSVTPRCPPSHIGRNLCLLDRHAARRIQCARTYCADVRARRMFRAQAGRRGRGIGGLEPAWTSRNGVLILRNSELTSGTLTVVSFEQPTTKQCVTFRSIVCAGFPNCPGVVRFRAWLSPAYFLRRGRNSHALFSEVSGPDSSTDGFGTRSSCGKME